jgi:hypothetical protein
MATMAYAPVHSGYGSVIPRPQSVAYMAPPTAYAYSDPVHHSYSTVSILNILCKSSGLSGAKRGPTPPIIHLVALPVLCLWAID